MSKKSSKKKPRDLNKLAHSITDEATGESPSEEIEPDEGKNPNPVALGKLGGKKGGRARAEKLSPEQRSEIAKKAAQARRGKKDKEV